MRKKKISVFLIFLLLSGCARTAKLDLSRWKSMPALEPFKENERVLIFAPHPDDEIIACAGIIQQALAAKAKVKVVYLTNGDHNEPAFIVYEKRITMRQGEFIHMGKLRQQESIKAMKFLGLSENDLVFLGYPDYGTFEIFCKYWQAKKPFRDRLTRISSVPYENNLSYGNTYIAENILSGISGQILDYQPDKIFVSHPCDVNVDHKSLYLFLQVALSDLEGQVPPLKVYPYLVHCVGWPLPRHYHPELELFPPDKFVDSRINWVRANLSFDELDKKYQAALFCKSQTRSSGFYLFSFIRENELFGAYADSELGLDSYARQDDYIIVRVDKPEKFSGRFGVMLYLFGYSKNTAFEQMPKVRIITSGNKYKVFNGKNRVTDSGVLLDLGNNVLILKIPLNFLNQPDYILASLKAYHIKLPVDVVGFRRIKIK